MIGEKAVRNGRDAGASRTRYRWGAQVALTLAILIGLFGPALRVAAGEVSLLRGIEADTARWVAKGIDYSISTARFGEADSARWAAAGGYYLALCQVGSLIC